MEDVQKLFIDRNASIRDVMQAITRAAKAGLPGGVAIVVDEHGKIIGVVTDGDIRRALLAGSSMDDSITNIYTKDPIVFPSSMSNGEILDRIPRRLKEMGRYRGGVLEKIILVDDDYRVERVVDFVELWKHDNALHKNVAVVGMGYVGLTLAVALADVGFYVTGVENNEEILQDLERGVPHFHEVGLEPIMKHHIGKKLKVTPVPPENAEYYVLAVATPIQEDNIPYLGYLEEAVRQVGKVLSYGDVVIIRSTCPLGTSRKIVIPLLEETSGLKAGRDFYMAFAPERTIEGKALQELRTLPQVIGGYDQNSVELTANLFRELSPLIISVRSLEAAEMVKLVNNSFRDLKFAFANELAILCEHFNLDAVEIVRAANEGYPRDPVPTPSPGVGGACLKKDPYIFAHAAKAAQLPDSLSLYSRRINESMPSLVSRKVLAGLKNNNRDAKDATVFIVGFAFKGEPETSDMRNSTTLDLLALLRDEVKTIRGYDPVITPEEIQSVGVTPVGLAEGFAGADAVIIMNNHRSYASMDIYDYLSSMNRPALYCDTWYIFSPDEIKEIEGITYAGLGFTE